MDAVPHPQSLDERVTAAEAAIEQLQESAPPAWWQWFVMAGAVLATFLMLLRIRDHFANRARVRFDVQSATYRVTHSKLGNPAPRAEADYSRTWVEVSLELRNTGRASTTLRRAAVSSSNALMQDFDLRIEHHMQSGPIILERMPPQRIEPGDAIRLQLQEGWNEDVGVEGDVNATLELQFTNRTARRRVILRNNAT